MPLTPAQQIAFADFEEGFLSRYIILADTKAGLAFSLNAGLLAFLLAAESTFSGLRTHDLLTLSAVAVPLVAGALSLAVILPRLRSSTEGLVFWRAVRKRDEATYLTDVQGITLSELAAARLSHCYAVAGVAQSKYSLLWWAMVLSGAAVVLVGAHTLATRPTDGEEIAPSHPAVQVNEKAPLVDKEAGSKSELSCPPLPAAIPTECPSVPTEKKSDPDVVQSRPSSG